VLVLLSDQKDRMDGCKGTDVKRVNENVLCTCSRREHSLSYCILLLTQA